MAAADRDEEQASGCVARVNGRLAGSQAGRGLLMPQPHAPQQVAAAPVRALAVVVLYRRAPEESLDASKTLTGLAQAFAEDASLARQLDVLLWDNSPERLSEQAKERSLPFAFSYQHAIRNQGVSGAYNAAAVLAEQRGCAWLLLLDDDTSVTAEFLRGMLGHAAQVMQDELAEDERIAAVAPFLYAGSFCMSPRLWRFARHVPLPLPEHPYTEMRSIFAANSGTLMRVRALEAIGGYNPRFWLDFSDIEVFHRLHGHGFSVRVASDLRLEHEMAMLDYDRRMTPERFATFLAAESDFMDLYRGPLERVMHLLRLAARVMHQRSYADPAFARLSWQALRERLTTRRAVRLARHERARHDRMRSAGANRG
jgi:GT2 family glycosyltransferase